MSDADCRRSTESLLSQSSDSGADHERTPLSPSNSNELGSTTRLVIVPHTPDSEASSFAFSDDEDADDPDYPSASQPALQGIHGPLSSLAAFAYFTSMHLKLGTMLVFGRQWPLKVVLPSLFVFAAISAFARQLWFLLARYVRKGTVEEIIQEAFVRGRRGSTRKAVVKSAAKFGVGLLRILLCIAYLRESVDVFVTNVFTDSSALLPRALIAVAATLFILLPLCVVSSLSSRRVIFSASSSIVLYVTWLLVVSVTRAKGLLPHGALVNPSKGLLWQSITTMAFAFTSVSSVQIYSALIGLGGRSSGNTKEKRFMSITSLSLGATALGVLLVLPLAFMQYPGADFDVSSQDGNSTTPTAPPTFDNAEQFSYTYTTKATLASLTSLTLLLGIPPLLVSSPPLPVPSALRRMTKLPLGRLTQLLIILLASLLPTRVMSVLLDITLVLALASTYFLPALAHVIHHHLRRPLSIIMQRDNSNSSNGNGSGGRSPNQSPVSPIGIGAGGYDPATEELLLRKEHALQRRRLGRRIVWDVGVWTLLIPMGLGGTVWAIGCIAGKW